MRRLAIVGSMLTAMLLMPAGAAAAADKDGCPAAAGGWERVTVDTTAEEFFDHLLPGYPWATMEEFASFLDATYDRDGDDWVCRKLMWGDALNPRSHWYRLGVEVLGEPVHVLLVMDDRANAQ